ncbi:MAG: hypothetical protein IJM09_02425 [Neisseriaceae bacterium]|nr:hypothetical protein [Neisseriaceae bacterium]
MPFINSHLFSVIRRLPRFELRSNLAMTAGLWCFRWRDAPTLRWLFFRLPENLNHRI